MLSSIIIFPLNMSLLSRALNGVALPVIKMSTTSYTALIVQSYSVPYFYFNTAVLIPVVQNDQSENQHIKERTSSSSRGWWMIHRQCSTFRTIYQAICCSAYDGDPYQRFLPRVYALLLAVHSKYKVIFTSGLKCRHRKMFHDLCSRARSFYLANISYTVQQLNR